MVFGPEQLAKQGAERLLSKEQLQAAASNYIECLRLPPASQILIVTDMMAGQLLQDPDTVFRRQFADVLTRQLASRCPVQRVEFNHSFSAQEMTRYTTFGLRDLEALSRGDRAARITTVIYVGDSWERRVGMYNAVNTFAQDRRVRMAGSLGMRTGDGRVMSQMGPEQLARIAATSEYFVTFFKENPAGILNYTTTDAQSRPHQLQVTYNTAYAPLELDLGQFPDETEATLPHQQPSSENYQYLNIPGGEAYLNPFSFTNSSGSFAAQGLVVYVEKGLAVGVDTIDQAATASLDNLQTAFINRVNKNQPLPLSEIGLGFYAMAGIPTYDDCSLLASEKAGPHFGFGQGYLSSESEEIVQLSGDFHHTDFVMNRATEIDYVDPETWQSEPLYLGLK